MRQQILHSEIAHEKAYTSHAHALLNQAPQRYTLQEDAWKHLLDHCRHHAPARYQELQQQRDKTVDLVGLYLAIMAMRYYGNEKQAAVLPLKELRDAIYASNASAVGKAQQHWRMACEAVTVDEREATQALCDVTEIFKQAKEATDRDYRVEEPESIYPPHVFSQLIEALGQPSEHAQTYPITAEAREAYLGEMKTIAPDAIRELEGQFGPTDTHGNYPAPEALVSPISNLYARHMAKQATGHPPFPTAPMDADTLNQTDPISSLIDALWTHDSTRAAEAKAQLAKTLRHVIATEAALNQYITNQEEILTKAIKETLNSIDNTEHFDARLSPRGMIKEILDMPVSESLWSQALTAMALIDPTMEEAVRAQDARTFNAAMHAAFYHPPVKGFEGHVSPRIDNMHFALETLADAVWCHQGKDAIARHKAVLAGKLQGLTGGEFSAKALAEEISGKMQAFTARAQGATVALD